MHVSKHGFVIFLLLLTLPVFVSAVTLGAKFYSRDSLQRQRRHRNDVIIKNASQTFTSCLNFIATSNQRLQELHASLAAVEAASVVNPALQASKPAIITAIRVTHTLQNGRRLFCQKPPDLKLLVDRQPWFTWFQSYSTRNNPQNGLPLRLEHSRLNRNGKLTLKLLDASDYASLSTIGVCGNMCAKTTWRFGG